MRKPLKYNKLNGDVVHGLNARQLKLNVRVWKVGWIRQKISNFPKKLNEDSRNCTKKNGLPFGNPFN